MKSIAKRRVGVKPIVYKRERSYLVRVGDLGTSVSRVKSERQADFAEMISRMDGKWHLPPKRTRGDISGFSENSQSRLRVALSTARWKGTNCSRVGLTLTLPWAASPEQWRQVWHDWVMSLRSMTGVSVIWRIELTTGQAAKSGGVRRCHVHAMVWFSSDKPLSKTHARLWSFCNDEERKSFNMETVANSWIDNWNKYINRFDIRLHESQFRYAISIGTTKGNGVLVKWLDNSTDGAIHYLCDHASKHKQEQLGWVGRQWGIINRRNFDFSQGQELDGRTWVVASRQLRRLSAKRRSDKNSMWQLPYGDNKCWFGKAEGVMLSVLNKAASGEIG